VINVVYLSMYPVIFAALVRIASPRDRRRSIDSVIDSAVLLLTGVLLLQVFVINPQLAAYSTVDWFAAVYPFGDALLLAAIGWLVFTRTRGNASVWLLGAGLVMLIGADAAWETTQRFALASWDQWINPLYPISYAVIAAAVLHPAAGHLADRSDTQPSQLHPLRLTLLCAALGLIPIAAFLETTNDARVEVLTSALVVAVGVRLAVLMRAMQNAHRRFANLAAALPVGIFESDAALNIVFANATAQSAIGASVVGMTAEQLISRVVDPSDHEVLRHALDTLVAGDASSVQVRFRDADGSQHWVAWSAVPARNGPGPFTGAFVSTTDITALKDAEEMLSLQATHDTLTGLPNRRMLFDRLATAITRLGRQPGMLAVLFLDLDGFKPVNDRYGHDAGDEVLTVIAGRMRETVRAEDTVARLGGDEFVTILERVTDPAQAAQVAGKIIQAIASPIVLTAGDARATVQVSASVGIATSDDPHTNLDALVRDADAAMYEAKQAGHGHIRFSKQPAQRALTPPVT
jgi:diguanylate cyclase (GGDEF)-like protein/PAS domain S-box-containing protein